MRRSKSSTLQLGYSQDLKARLLKYTNQRLRMMRYFGAHKSLEKVEAANRIIRQLDFFKDSPGLLNVIARLEKDAYMIKPGRNSKYFKSASKELEYIFSHTNHLS